ncbi:MAG TPA: 16S rRNA (guanine(966)-N(2))-methyltransferase RsmD [Candidatus Brachybacterium merdavium]|uniref:16S rRNA (Guanine(966)-N(2))-methyltransferase RsmD n=1 Tax=Candidatus Brachybacterium merdavium TaxID=2838513 RepID=A0A9D2RPM1_9MICO|nr:16S rRNA (guanine(966)-N(2))-methyltransferase RsmD [Candidatus Brachybacterium merdavium]
MPRIIAGALGGRFVPGPPGRGTRPTADRVREALFSRLDGWDTLQGARVLDLFAGTGVLSFESISRGAEDAVMVEMHAPTARALRATAKELGIADRCQVHAGKALHHVQQLLEEPPAQPFTLIFLDPPYGLAIDGLEELLVTLRPVLADDALAVIERSSRTRPLQWPDGWADDGTKKYGETVLQYGGPIVD